MPKKKVEEERKIQIFEAFGKCLEKKAFHETGTREIAKKANVNHGMLYYFFKNKDDILLQYIDYLILKIRNDFDDYLSSFNAKFYDNFNLFKKIYEYGIRRITLNRQLIKIFVELWSIGSYNKKVRDKLKKTYDEWINIVENVIKKTSHINEKDAKIMSYFYVSSLEGISLFSLIYDDREPTIQKLIKWHQNNLISLMTKK